MLGRLLSRLVVLALVGAAAGTGVRLAGPPAASAAPVGQWSSGGPYADDATAVAASPAFDADGTVFMGVSYETKAGQPDVQGVAAILRSTDGGLTWTTAYSRSSTPGTTKEWLTQIVVSPAFAADRTVFATWSEGLNGAMLRSTDGGASFQQVSTAGLETANKTLSMSPTYGSDHTIAVTASAGTSAVSYVSTDSGSTWRQVNVAVADPCAGTLTGGGFLLALGGSRLGSYVPNSSAVCSNNLDQLFAVSADGGATWAKSGDVQQAVGGANNFDDQHSRLVSSSDGRTLLYSDQYGNALRSSDGGATWANLEGPTSTLGHDILAGSSSPTGQEYDFSFASPSTVYAVHDWAKSQPRLYRSTDGGASWSVLWHQNGVTVIHDTAPAGANTLFYAEGNLGLLRSTDLSQTWRSVGSFEPALHAVAPSPSFQTDSTLFAVSYPSGLPTVGQDTPAYGIYRSTDGGLSWHEPEAPNPGLGDIFTTAANGGLSLAPSPGFASDGTVFEGDNRGAVSISHDGGLTWAVSLLGSPPQAGWYVYGLQPSPSFRTDRTVYLGLGNQGFGVAKSSDGGQTWFSDVPVDRADEIADDFVRDLAVSQEPSGVVDLVIGLGITGLIDAKDTPSATTPPEWAGMSFANTDAIALSPAYQRDCTAFVAGLAGTLDQGVYRSTDACINGSGGAVQWQRTTTALPVRDFQAVALSPGFASDRTAFIGSATAGVWVSQSAGGGWSALSSGLGNSDVHKLAVAPTGTGTGLLFAATDAGVWRAAVPLTAGAPTLTPYAFLPRVAKNAAP